MIISPDQLILIVEDDVPVRKVLAGYFEDEGIDVLTAGSLAEARGLFPAHPGVVLLDLRLPDGHGLTLLREIKDQLPHCQVIVFSSDRSPDMIVQAIKHGAFWYLTKGGNRHEIVSLVQRAFSLAESEAQCSALRSLESVGEFPLEFVAEDQAGLELRRMVGKLAPQQATVLLQGETGTGKSFLARILHLLGPQPEAPFVTVSCAALPRDLLEAELFGYVRGAFTGSVQDRAGRVEAAHGGTLFLDEIGEMPLELQPKLLLFLQDHRFQRIGDNRERSVDVRVIAATNRKLEEMVQAGEFRADLFYRLDVASLRVPALRERPSDILPLAHRFLEKLNARSGSNWSLSPGAAAALQRHSWPGNIRELENVLERATIFSESPMLKETDLRLANNAVSQPRSESLAGLTLDQVEKIVLSDTLNATQNNKRKTAQLLGVTEKTVYRKLSKYGLD